MAMTHRWFPRLRAGFAAPAAPHVEKLVSVSWLLMTELFAYLEDVGGAGEDESVLDALAIRMAELAFNIDGRLRGDTQVEELHEFPLLLEYGLTDLAHLDGEGAAEALALSAPANAPGARGARLLSAYMALIDQFPGRLFNTLLPESQSQTLRTLRAWNKLCVATGTDPAFLAPLMRSL
jgi:hypothetical protein